MSHSLGLTENVEKIKIPCGDEEARLGTICNLGADLCGCSFGCRCQGNFLYNQN